MPTTDPTAARVIVRLLELQGVRRVFCVPGESYLAVLDALHDSDIDTVVCRQEGGAAMMAEATGKLTGRPGIAFVTRGPGATNAAAGLHIAAQDSSPMILFVGQVGRDMKGREAFQELDYRAVFGSIAKWVVEIDDPARTAEIVGRAFQVAMNGRPGPVVVALPEDMLHEAAPLPALRPREAVPVNPGLNMMIRLQKKLWAAERPIAILGGSGWTEAAVAAFRRFAERFDLPVACSFRRQMLFDHLHPNYAGDIGIGANPALVARIRASDLVLLVGGRMSEMPSQGYELFAIPEPEQPLVHVHADPEELGRVYHAEIAINASPAGFAAAAEGLQPPNEIVWRAETVAANAAYHAWSDTLPATPGAVQMGEVIETLRDVLADDAVLTNGAGNYATWIHRFWRFRRFGTQLAPTSGSMGYGLPAAIAGKLERPEAQVICLAGDGCFQMTCQEFGTAVQAGANVIVLVVDNGIYGTIRMHQERNYPERISATTLVNPDFAALARAYGGHGETVRETAEFAGALDRAMAAGKPALIHLLTDPEAITPTATITGLRAAARKTDLETQS
ncbi:thiamine pyrophosphate-binding protein [Methylobrevis pamukkalensis]|uniref:Acetolactate synthase isozyme 2 large subunit n=1 Tax=Methylobrevis pamukkalensis TaxID=1439726 RepID=A0A1E3H5D5_9HYPH|nr:thiamine pyrophosphate-binding protein [Methylobrevis pamukkalensis]ODN71549.1 Acetolactate synthase isozyme 2 large subunit [Methylobrevis pamukkalensis]